MSQKAILCPPWGGDRTLRKDIHNQLRRKFFTKIDKFGTFPVKKTGSGLSGKRSRWHLKKKLFFYITRKRERSVLWGIKYRKGIEGGEINESRLGRLVKSPIKKGPAL